jgi:hypothetical protein
MSRLFIDLTMLISSLIVFGWGVAVVVFLGGIWQAAGALAMLFSIAVIRTALSPWGDERR